MSIFYSTSGFAVIIAAVVVIVVLILALMMFVWYLVVRTAVKNGIDRSQLAQFMKKAKLQELQNDYLNRQDERRSPYEWHPEE